MSAATFTSNRLSWLEAIAADGRLHSTAIRVAVVIASHLNRQTGEAFPSIKTIAAKSAKPERSVERAIAQLCDAGYLERRRAGFSQANRYSIPENSPHRCNVDPVSIPAADGGTVDAIPAAGGGTVDAIPAMGGGSLPPLVADHSRHGWRTNPLIEPIDNNLRDISPPQPPHGLARKGREGAEGFERFYQVFPRKAGRGAARKAWQKAIKAADPEAIIAGAERYAAERAGQEPRFTAHPSSWLNAERWTDEPAPPPLPLAAPNGELGRWRTSKDRTGDAIRAVLARVGGDHEH